MFLEKMSRAVQHQLKTIFKSKSRTDLQLELLYLFVIRYEIIIYFLFITKLIFLLFPISKSIKDAAKIISYRVIY